MRARVLIVDDEQTIRTTLGWCFAREGFTVATVATGEAAVTHLETEDVDVIVCDIILPRMSGLDLLRRARTVKASIVVILITAYATVETAVEALRQGASDYVVKPFRLQDVVARVRSLVPVGRATDGTGGPADGSLIGCSQAVNAVREQIARLATTNSNVLITGETGTGKELVARAIHATSRRRGHRFVPVNCAAIPETLFESLVFGHVKGAFTSAAQDNPGLLSVAHHGTLFLDEVGELPLAVQVKLLRVIEGEEVWAVGATKPRRVDSRVIAATNRDIRREVEGGKFRKDLFYRLNVSPVTLPPLREHPEDIPFLIEHFIGRLNEKLDRRVTGIEPAALEAMMAHEWPGNVRQLEHVLESAMIAEDGVRISLDRLPAEISRRQPAPSLRDSLRRFERQQILATLSLTRFDKREAARRLGLSLASLYRKLEDHAIQPLAFSRPQE